MPLFTLKTNLKIENKAALAELASSTVANILSKPESYVMVHIEDAQCLTFAGSHAPCALLQLKSLGLPEQQTTEFSQQLCHFVQQQLAIQASRVYIEYHNPQRHLWGWDSRTF